MKKRLPTFGRGMSVIIALVLWPNVLGQVEVERFTLVNASLLKVETGTLYANGGFSPSTSQNVSVPSFSYSSDELLQIQHFSGRPVMTALFFDAFNAVGTLPTWAIRSEKTFPMGYIDYVIVGIAGISDPNAPTITSYENLPLGAVNAAFKFTFSALEGTLPYTWTLIGALPAGFVLGPATGTISGKPTQQGISTFTIRVTDARNRTMQKSFTLTVGAEVPLPNLVPYKPDGWSDKLVASVKSGDHTDAHNIFDNQDIFVSWAVVNDSSVNIADTFWSKLFIDGLVKKSWYAQGLDAGHFAWVNDFNMGALSAGNHTIQLEIDTNGDVLEASKSDNTFTKNIIVDKAPLPKLFFARTGLSGIFFESKYFKVILPPGLLRATFSTSGGTGDCDLFVSYGWQPAESDLESYDFQSRNRKPLGSDLSGNDEYIAVNNPAAGDYYVLVYGFNPFSNVDLKVFVTYSGGDPPVVTAQPKSQTVPRGRDVTFSVTATGAQPMWYQWRKDGLNLSGATNATLIIANAQTNAAGIYSVVIYNGGGSAASTDAVLTVNVPQLGFPPTNIADFNEDNEADVVFQDADGNLAVWFMKAAKLEVGSLLSPSRLSDNKWQIVGSGDFKNEEKSDLLFQHADGTLAVWFMDGLKQKSAALLDPSNPGDAQWRVVATSDFNSDGKTDLVFQHADGTIAFWFLDGMKRTSASLLNPPKPPSGWRVVGAGDFNADGQTDLLLQHTAGGLLVWFLDGLTKVGEAYLDPSSVAPTWHVVSVRDRNNDGQPDLLFQHADGTLRVWFMDGTRATSSVPLEPQSPGGSWRVVAP